MSYTFQSSSYQTRSAMLLAIAETWVTANGQNTAKDAFEAFETPSDELARECIEAWGLDKEDRHGDRPAHTVENDYDADDLAAAFETLLGEWLADTDRLPLDLRDEVISARMKGETVELHKRGGTGDSVWTDADSVDDAFRRYASNDISV